MQTIETKWATIACAATTDGVGPMVDFEILDDDEGWKDEFTPTQARAIAAALIAEADAAEASTMTFVAVSGQSFATKQDWINRASSVLTFHPDYNDTAHRGPEKGWRGYHFTALCFDQKGRRTRNGGDFQRAEDDGAYPVWWVWPDQISGLLMVDAAEGK